MWIDYFRGTVTAQPDQLDRLLGHEPLANGDLILSEVLQGFDSERDFKAAQRLLTTLQIVEIGGMADMAPMRNRVLTIQT